MFGILAAVIVLIVYGSLFPWHFVAKQLPASPLYLLFHSWGFASGRRFVADVIVNIALYIPLGMSAFLAFRSKGWRWAAWLLPVPMGAVLSGCIEMTQLFTPNRNCSTEDLITNILGSAVGVLAGALFAKLARPVRQRRPADTSALALLFCGLAALVFPFFPVMQLIPLRQKLDLFAHSLSFNPVPFLSAAAMWMALGLLLRAVKIRHALWWLSVFVLLIPAQVGILNRQPRLTEIAGAIAGICLCAALKKAPELIPFAAWAFLAILVFRGLAPFDFSPASQGFQWIPFGGFLNTDWQIGVQGLLEKLFLYGSAVWLLRRGGVLWTPALAAVCIALTLIEIAQTHIPAHTAEITDPILALMAGLGLRVLKAPIGYHANS